MQSCLMLACHKMNAVLAREGQPPAKDPPNSQAYIHPSIQAYTQNKAEAILTSIYIKQSRRIPTKTKQTHYNNAPPQTAPQKTTQKKYITLYNSKYCIR